MTTQYQHSIRVESMVLPIINHGDSKLQWNTPHKEVDHVDSASALAAQTAARGCPAPGAGHKRSDERDDEKPDHSRSMAAVVAAAHERSDLVFFRVRSDVLHRRKHLGRMARCPPGSGFRRIRVLRRQCGCSVVRPQRHDHGYLADETRLPAPLGADLHRYGLHGDVCIDARNHGVLHHGRAHHPSEGNRCRTGADRISGQRHQQRIRHHHRPSRKADGCYRHGEG